MFRPSAYRNVKLSVLLLAGIVLSVAGFSSSHATAQPAVSPKFVQEKDKEAIGKTVAQSFTNPTATGNLLVAYVIWDNTGTASVSDSKGDTFVSAGLSATTFSNNKYS